jgi:hypothetical protein
MKLLQQQMLNQSLNPNEKFVRNQAVSNKPDLIALDHIVAIPNGT